MVNALSTIALMATIVIPAPNRTELRREELMEALRKGGYTVMLRHARTDRSFNEQRDPVPTERNKQRNLTDDGIRDAALMGVVFRKYGIQFAEIISSPMYRCIETAEYSAGRPTSTTMALRTFPATSEQATLVAKAPGPGTNRLIVTHHFVIETHVPGIKPGDVAESEAAVVRHTADGKVELVGRITLDDWRSLANPGGVATPSTAPAQATHASMPVATSNGVKIPDSHAGHIASEYIKAFNSGSDDSMKVFLGSWMRPNPDRTIDERVRGYRQLFAEHGPLTVIAVHENAQIEVVLGIKSRVGEFRLTVKSSEDQPMKGSSITLASLQGHRE